MTGGVRVENLAVEVGAPGAARRAVDRVWLELRPGRLLALVGPSGAGKSLLAQALLGMAPPGARIASGRVELAGRDVLRMRGRELRRVRGGGIALVPQHPAAALTPTRTVGSQLAEVLRLHRGADRAGARREGLDWLRRVGVADAEARWRDHPHRLSGGQRQRVAVALALAAEPAVIVADEPTASLDPVLTAATMALLAERRDAGRAVLVVSHDLGAVAGVADQVAVIDRGALVEHGPVHAVLGAPRHPTTAALVAAARA